MRARKQDRAAPRPDRDADQPPAPEAAGRRRRSALHGRARGTASALALRRALGKQELRLLGIEDGPFTRRHRFAPLVAVVVVAPGRVDAVALGRVRVDGGDANEAIEALVRGTGQLPGVRAILLDGISFGGFNLVDLPRLSRSLERPVVSVTPRPPDLEAMQSAIRRYFPDEYRRRWGRVQRAPVRAVRVAGGTLYCAVSGAPRSVLPALLSRAIVRGRWPEVLSVARRFARAVGRPVPSPPAGEGPARGTASPVRGRRGGKRR